MTDDARDPSARPVARIQVVENGPYFVSGLPVVAKDAAYTADGEPITWVRRGPIDDRPRYALCRCGQSASKPFCDGTHAKVGFDGSETDDRADRAARRKSFGTDALTVHDDRSICVHAGFCGTKVSNVWKMAASAEDTAMRSQVIAMVERCPSGALTYALDPAGDEIEPGLAAEVAVVTDGPLFVTGGVEILRSDGSALESRNRVTLCRCGASKKKPLCDGTHKEIGFTHTATDARQA